MEHLLYVVAGELLKSLFIILEIVRAAEKSEEIIAYPIEIPLRGILGNGEAVDRRVDRLVDHGVNRSADIRAVKHLAALLVDYVSLLVHDVVVAEDSLSALEVLILKALLSALDGV